MRRLLRAPDLAGEQLQRWESLQWHCRALEEAANDLGAGACHYILPACRAVWLDACQGYWSTGTMRPLILFGQMLREIVHQQSCLHRMRRALFRMSEASRAIAY